MAADPQPIIRPWRLGAVVPLMLALGVAIAAPEAWYIFAFFLSAAVIIWWAPPRGDQPAAVPARDVQAIGASARRTVETLKTEYGALLTDVVYRIENAALFDNAVPLTKDFQLALIKWDDEEPVLDERALGALAREVKLAFDTAKRHAETIGMRHLPEAARDDAAQAAKAARLAAGAQTDGERRAALTQVNRLLASLALYYLPSEAEVPQLGQSPGPGNLAP